MLLVGEVKAVVGLGMFIFFLGKIQKIWQKLYHLSDMFPCLGGGLFFCCALCLKSGGLVYFVVVFWICGAREFGFTGTQHIRIVQNPTDSPACSDAGRVF